MIQCIVIDDEPLAVKLIASYVERHPALSLVATYTDPIVALHELEKSGAQLVFLDIQMPQLSGIQFLKIINNKIAVILTTAYDEYALESYDYQVVDYLVKPISYERFERALEKYFRYTENATSISKAAIKNTPASLGQLFIKSGYKTIRLSYEDILYLESKGDYLNIVTESDTIKSLENLKDIIKRLPPTLIRTHRSFIVNINKINYVENNRIIIAGHFIPISRAYQNEVMERLR